MDTSKLYDFFGNLVSGIFLLVKQIVQLDISWVVVIGFIALIFYFRTKLMTKVSIFFIGFVLGYLYISPLLINNIEVFLESKNATYMVPIIQIIIGVAVGYLLKSFTAMVTFVLVAGFSTYYIYPAWSNYILSNKEAIIQKGLQPESINLVIYGGILIFGLLLGFIVMKSLDYFYYFTVLALSIITLSTVSMVLIRYFIPDCTYFDSEMMILKNTTSFTPTFIYNNLGNITGYIAGISAALFMIKMYGVKQILFVNHPKNKKKDLQMRDFDELE